MVEVFQQYRDPITHETPCRSAFCTEFSWKLITKSLVQTLWEPFLTLSMNPVLKPSLKYFLQKCWITSLVKDPRHTYLQTADNLLNGMIRHPSWECVKLRQMLSRIMTAMMDLPFLTKYFVIYPNGASKRCCLSLCTLQVLKTYLTVTFLTETFFCKVFRRILIKRGFFQINQLAK